MQKNLGKAELIILMVLGVCAVEMIVARKWGIEAGFSRFGGA